MRQAHDDLEVVIVAPVRVLAEHLAMLNFN